MIQEGYRRDAACQLFFQPNSLFLQESKTLLFRVAHRQDKLDLTACEDMSAYASGPA